MLQNSVVVCFQFHSQCFVCYPLFCSPTIMQFRVVNHFALQLSQFPAQKKHPPRWRPQGQQSKLRCVAGLGGPSGNQWVLSLRLTYNSLMRQFSLQADQATVRSRTGERRITLLQPVISFSRSFFAQEACPCGCGLLIPETSRSFKDLFPRTTYLPVPGGISH